jgi:molecular chaperone Hsp33
MMNDYLVRIISPDANVLGLACVTTGLVNHACRLHGTHPTASAALGRALTGGALMGALLKNDQRVGLKIEGGGPLKKIIVEADNFGTVRGFVGVPEVDLPPKNGKIDVAGAIGHAGFLTVIKDLGLKKPYEGIVQLRTSEIAEDIAFYFAESEQIPSAVSLGVYVAPDAAVSAAGGFLIQALPPSDDNVIDTLIGQIGSIPPVSEFYREGKTPEDLLTMIFNEIPFHVIEKRDLSYECTCSRAKIEKVVRSLGRDEIEAIIREQGEAEIVCEFCRTTYQLNGEELDHILATL